LLYITMLSIFFILLYLLSYGAHVACTLCNTYQAVLVYTDIFSMCESCAVSFNLTTQYNVFAVCIGNLCGVFYIQ